MKILVLNTGLFHRNSVLENALVKLGSEHRVSRYDANDGLSEDDWDRVVKELVSADRVITL